MSSSLKDGRELKPSEKQSAATMTAPQSAWKRMGWRSQSRVLLPLRITLLARILPDMERVGDYSNTAAQTVSRPLNASRSAR